MLTQEQKGVRTSARALGVLFALLFLLLPSSSAAQVITFTSATASWRDAQDNLPGSQPGDPVITNGVPTSSVSWGGANPQSGYDVTITIPDPTLPPVADFAHRNFPVPSPSLTSIVLDMIIGFDIDGVPDRPADLHLPRSATRKHPIIWIPAPTRRRRERGVRIASRSSMHPSRRSSSSEERPTRWD